MGSGVTRAWIAVVAGISIAGSLSGCKSGTPADTAAAGTTVGTASTASVTPEVKDMLQRQTTEMQRRSSGYSDWLKQHPKPK